MAGLFIEGPDNWENRKRHPAYWLATGFGFGLMRYAPGTWGSLLALIIAFCMLDQGFEPQSMLMIGMALVAFAIGIWVVDIWERRTEEHDNSAIVIDEIAGMWLAIYPIAANWDIIQYKATWMLAAFAVFRFFDVIKPFPVNWFDNNVPGALGVMLDDVVAGVISGIIIFAIMTITYS